MTKHTRPAKKSIVLTQAQAYAVAAAAQVDPRTVKRVAAGLPTRQMITDRVMSALKSTGIILLLLLVIGCGIPKGESEMASTVSLVQMLAAGMTTSAGLPLASGRARFYLPATLTPVSVYADSAAATPVSPPLILTAGGTGIAYTKVPTRMIVKTADDVTTVFDGLVNIERAEQQYIQSTSVNGGAETTLQAFLDGMATSLGGTAGLWQFKAGTGGTERNLVSVINDVLISVKSFGAAGNNIADDTTKIQATIDFVQSLGGGVVFLPPGIYLTTALITLPSSGKVEIHGATIGATFVNNTSGTLGVFSTPDLVTSVFKNLTITHSSSSTGTAVVASGIGSVLFDHVSIGGHLGSASSSGGTIYSKDSTFAATGAGTAVTAAGLISTASNYSTNTGTAALVTNVRTTLDRFTGGTGIGLDIPAGGSMLAAASVATGLTGLRTATTTLGVLSSSCNWGTVDDRRAVGSAVVYSFAADGNFTPLPSQTDTIRVTVTAAAVVTINAAIATGFGRKFSLMLCRSTAGAVTWTFDASYILQGAAAPAPTNGNMMISVFEYDAISAKYRETSRSASMAI